MTINTTSADNTLTVTLTGRMDTAAAPTPEEMIRNVSRGEYILINRFQSLVA